MNLFRYPPTYRGRSLGSSNQLYIEELSVLVLLKQIDYTADHFLKHVIIKFDQFPPFERACRGLSFVLLPLHSHP